MLFLRKTDETMCKPPFLRLSPLSTNPCISEQFFHDPPLSNFQKRDIAPLILGGGGDYGATAQLAPELLKTLAILSDTYVRRSAVDRDNLKPY